MNQENEIITLLLGTAVLVFILINRKKLVKITASSLFISAFSLIYAGWFFSIFEEFLWKKSLNVIEHLSYAGSAVCIAIWFFRVFKKDEEAE